MAQTENLDKSSRSTHPIPNPQYTHRIIHIHTLNTHMHTNLAFSYTETHRVLHISHTLPYTPTHI